MVTQHRADARVIEVLSGGREFSLDELMQACSDLSWSQVFLALDRLSRGGQVRLALGSPGLYRVSLPGTMRPRAAGDSRAA